jgi:hypothetical protein
VYELSAAVRITRNENGGVVLDINNGKVFRLNPVAALIFERLQERQTEIQISEHLSRQFNISVPTVHGDIVEFLKSLERQGLVRAT